jgi:hypothetical protein
MNSKILIFFLLSLFVIVGTTSAQQVVDGACDSAAPALICNCDGSNPNLPIDQRCQVFDNDDFYDGDDDDFYDDDGYC